MNCMDSIIRDYASADETGRLHLFLNHRHLRDRFMQIDMAESAWAQEKQSAKLRISWVERFLQYFPGCSKYYKPS